MPANTSGIAAPVPSRISAYRLLVRAVDDPRRKGFVWEIFPMGPGRAIDRAVVNDVQINGRGL